MRKFVLKTVFFLLLCLAFIGVFFLMTVHSGRLKAESHTFPQNIKTIFIGDSHVQKALNDTLFRGVMNLGRNSETTYHSFHKLKAILNCDNQFEHVVLGFGYHNLSSYSDEFVFGQKSHLINPPYFKLLPIQDQIKLLGINAHKVPGFTKSIIKDIHRSNSDGSSPFPGKFINEFSHSEVRDSSVQKRLRIQFEQNTLDHEQFSSTNIDYLDSIIQLTEEKGIELFILNTPIYKTYREQVPEAFSARHKELQQQLSLREIIVDFNESERTYFIPDGDHLSAEGAIEFTRLLQGSTFSFLFNEHSLEN